MSTLVQEKLSGALFLVLGSLLTAGLAWGVVGRSMPLLLEGAVLLLIFLVCFFSVKISLVLLLCSMLLSPEIVVGSTAARDVTIRLEDLLLMIMSVGWLFRMAILKDIGFSLRTPLNWPIVAYLSIVVLSTSLGIIRGNVNPLSGLFFSLKLIEYFVLFFVVINYATEIRDVHQMVTIMLAVCGAICVYGIFMIATGGDVAAPFQRGAGERNTLGGYLVLMGSVGGGILLKTDSKVERSLLGFLVPTTVFVLLFSMSRSGWVSAMVSSLVLVPFTRRRGVYLLVILVAIVVIIVFVPESVATRATYTFSQPLHPAQFALWGIRFDTSTSARIVSALTILKRFTDRPVFGFGVTGFGFIDGQYFRDLIEIGVAGLGSFLVLLGSVHRLMRRALTLSVAPRLQGMIVGLYAGFWGLIAHAFTANTFIITRISEPFWCLVGLVVVITLVPHHAAGVPAEGATGLFSQTVRA